ncbi:hypothetical protein FACS1894140_6800 [Spirochaetia bacterium]|nr:hypothetical protein FACS1894140_6800 [Spirochaetia bacterium]
MNEVWSMQKIKQLLSDNVQESLNLDYKAADALSKTDVKKAEITKDISAMANSDGGIIIYGIKEDQNNKNFPGEIDPINQKEFSKEWLEQVINNIRPKIEGIIITSIPVDKDNNTVIYVVQIPQSTTVHQALDKRYFKRFNFVSTPMDDYEIRDVMGRGTWRNWEGKKGTPVRM